MKKQKLLIEATAMIVLALCIWTLFFLIGVGLLSEDVGDQEILFLDVLFSQTGLLIYHLVSILIILGGFAAIFIDHAHLFTMSDKPSKEEIEAEARQYAATYYKENDPNHAVRIARESFLDGYEAGRQDAK